MLKSLHMKNSENTLRTVSENEKITLFLNKEEKNTLEQLGKELAAKRDRSGNLKTQENITSIIKMIGSEDINEDKETRYEVSIPDYIGTLKIKNQIIEIQPKIGLDHFIHIIEAGSDVMSQTRLSKQQLSGSTGNLFWYMVANFLGETELLLKKGLLKGYKLREDQLRYITGRVNTLNTFRNFLKGNMLVDTEYEEFTEDIAINRVIKAGLERVLKEKVSFDTNSQLENFIVSSKKKARTMKSEFYQSGNLKFSDKKTVNFDRNNSYYKNSYKLALNILNFIYGQTTIGNTSISASLIKTSGLIEDGLKSYINSYIDPRFTPVKSERYSAERGSQNFDPDLIFGMKDNPIAAGDIKYSFFETLEDESKINWKISWRDQLSSWAIAANTKKVLIIAFDNQGLGIRSNGYFSINNVEYKFIAWNTMTSKPNIAGRKMISELESFLKG